MLPATKKQLKASSSLLSAAKPTYPFDVQGFLAFVQALHTNSELYILLQSKPVPYNNDSRILQLLRRLASQVNYILPHLENPLSHIQSRIAFPSVTACPSAAVLQLQDALQSYTKAKRSEHRRRQQTAHRIGITTSTTISAPIIDFPPLLEYYLSKLPRGEEYPPRKCYILESYSSTDSFPPIPTKKDRSCGYSSTFHRLDESHLAYQLSTSESAIFRDQTTKEVICIVIRDFAKDMSVLQPWATNLILDSLSRRNPCQRNVPYGHMAAVGVSTGPRDAALFGWVRNLLNPNASDRIQHEKDISSLFGIFYALLRAQVPWMAYEFEKVLFESGMPRLDQTGRSQFTIPLSLPITFDGYALAPPEGYISENYAKWIHRDSHWNHCPWAAYWNLVRQQKEGKIGSESGASFFISDYALRILNAANTFVLWNVSLWHGTGYYNHGLWQLGIALLLSKNLETVWKKYMTKLECGELKDGDLLYFLQEENED